MDGWTDGWMDGWVGERTDGRMDRWRTRGGGSPAHRDPIPCRQANCTPVDVTSVASMSAIVVAFLHIPRSRGATDVALYATASSAGPFSARTWK